MKTIQEQADELLPTPPSRKVWDLQQKASQSRSTLARLRSKMQDRPEVVSKVDDLDRLMQQRDSLLSQLRYSLEYREELKRKNVAADEVSALIPHPSTPFGKKPYSVVGLVTKDGRHLMFTKPIDVHRGDIPPKAAHGMPPPPPSLPPPPKGAEMQTSWT